MLILLSFNFDKIRLPVTYFYDYIWISKQQLIKFVLLKNYYNIEGEMIIY